MADIGDRTKLVAGGVRMGAAASRSADKHVVVGCDCMLECGLVLETNEARISIGSRTFIGGNTLLDSAIGIHVGDDVLVSFSCLIFDHDSHPMNWLDRERDVELWRDGRKDWTTVAMAPVTIEDRAWIGARSIILKGTTIGAEAIVGAGSVVTKDVPPGAVVAGVPARVIRKRENDS